ncbi:MAG: Asp-tRNA(Asn)/Glu-tRNA(Gln) amidotransferase GatCAB subunit B, partial [Candidatus Dormibacteraeota bacterium]|nr:Asp-tRNA(Asn)/Glu-tRNA(Gln) amidotransferase GatCAB subunit B [Candidatus Dormibacteraeota bacterium]
TVSQRSKESSHDYRYFPEPDLPPLRLDSEFVEHVRGSLPELPETRARRFQEQYGLSPYDASVLTATPDDAASFEELASRGVAAKTAANWLMGDVAALAREHRVPLRESALGLGGLASLLGMLARGTINGPVAKELLAELYVSGGDPEAVVQERGLAQLSDEASLLQLVDEVIAANAAAVNDFRSGKQQAFGSLVGAVKKASGGTADMRAVSRLLRERLEGG